MTTKAKPLRWSARKNDRHLSAATMQLARGDVVYVIAQHIRGDDEWFWYATGINTCQNPQPLETCKAQAMQHVRQRPDLKPLGTRS
jgi:hypothetical protein